MTEKQTVQKKYHYYVDFRDVPLVLFKSSRCLAEVVAADCIHRVVKGKSPTNTTSMGVMFC